MIITLCGSARFERDFHVWNEVLTLSGHTVFGLAVYPSFKKGEKNWYSTKEKTLLDKAHFRKIDASDAILVLNKWAYIGESTLKEIEYAYKNKKQVFFLESWEIGYGVGHLHKKCVRDYCKSIGILGKTSPIKTNIGPHLYNILLPNDRPLRIKLVDFINKNSEEELAPFKDNKTQDDDLENPYFGAKTPFMIQTERLNRLQNKSSARYRCLTEIARAIEKNGNTDDIKRLLATFNWM